MNKLLIVIPVACFTQQVSSKEITPDSLQQKKDLKELVVKANRPMYINKGNRLIFKVDNLKNTEGMLGLDILQYAPNLSIDAQENIKLNGKTPTVYLNDRKLAPGEVNSLLKGMQAGDIDRIDVRKSREASDDGDSGNGTVYVYTKRKTGLSGSVSMTGQLRAEHRYSFFPGMTFNYGSEHWNIYGSCDYYQYTGLNHSLNSSDVTDLNGAPVMAYNTKSAPGYFARQMLYRLGSTWTPDKKRHQTIGIELSGERDMTFHWTKNEDIQRKMFKDHLEDTGHNLWEQDKPSYNYNVALSWNWKLDAAGSYLRLLGNYFHMKSRSNSVQSTIYDHLSDWNSDETDVTLDKSHYYSLQADLQKTWGDWKLTSGVKYSTTRRDNNSTYYIMDATSEDDIRYHENITSGYASVSKHFKHVDLTAGIRLENTATNYRKNGNGKVERSYLNALPNFMFLHRLNDNWSYQLTYGITLTRPSFYSLSEGTMRLSDYTYSIGNPDLKAYTKQKGEFAVSYKQHTVSVGYRQSKNMIADIIARQDEKAQYWQTKNIGKYHEWYFDYNYTGNVFSWWNLNFYGEAASVHYPQNFRYRQLWEGYISMNSRFTAGEIGNFAINLQSVISDLEVNSKMTKGYTTVGLTYDRNFFHKKLNISISVSDLFHQFRQDYTDYFPTSTRTIKSYFPTRNVSLRLTYTFSSKRKVQDKNVENDNTINSRM